MASGSVLILIIRCETKLCDRNIDVLQHIFSHPYFIVEIVSYEDIIDPSKDSATGTPKSNVMKTFDPWSYHVILSKALEYAANGPYTLNRLGLINRLKQWEHLPCIVVKDSSVSNLTPRIMKDYVQHALRHPADLYFLCKWCDRCDNYLDVEFIAETPNTDRVAPNLISDNVITEVGPNIEDVHSNVTRMTSVLKWTTYSNTTQAIMFSPEARDRICELLAQPTNIKDKRQNDNRPTDHAGYVIGDEIANNKLAAMVFMPNIIDFDIDLATSNRDYAKLNQCSLVTTQSTMSNSVATTSWLLFMIVLIIIVAWILVQSKNPKYVTQRSHTLDPS